MKKNVIFGIVLGITFLFMVGVLTLIYFEIQKPTFVYHGTSEDGTFSTSFVRASHEAAKGNNYMVSPYSVEVALAMLRDGSNGDSLTELENIVPKRSIKTLAVSKRVNVANALFVRDKYKNDVRESYTKTLRDEYNAEFIYDAFQTPDKINNWVNKETNGMIQKILDRMDPDFVVGLANAVAMEEEWATPFECDITYSQSFTKINGKDYDVAMMHNNYDEGAYYYEGEGVTGVILPYKMYDQKSGKEVEEDGEQLDFVGLLPDDLDSYVENFTLDEVKNINDKMRSASDKLNISVGLPRYEFDYDFDMFKETLIHMGIQSVFSPDGANLSNMLDNHPDSYVSEAIHKSYVKVDEAGTKAAAVTYFGVKDSAMAPMDDKEYVQITFDKPFVFLIKDHNSNEILFFGVVYEPEKWNGKSCD